MNEFKHTPGKWTVDSVQSGIVRMNDYFRIEQTATSENMPDGMSLDDLEAEGDANAKLIAASPELLDALNECVSDLFYQIESKHGPEIASKYPCILKAKSAIEKATK